VLLLGCLVFHAHFAGPAGMLPIILLGSVTYAIGVTRNRTGCAVGIALCASALVFYKYVAFALGDVLAPVSARVAGWLSAAAAPLLPAAPPLAISFFTFEFVHYLYDVRRGHAPIRDPREFALFAVFWPSIVAGPIKRYQQFLPAVEAAVRTVSADDVRAGALRVSAGVLKKTVADNLTLYLEWTHPRFEAMTGPGRWAFVAGLSARILLDFSGYSDMAIGFARMCGVRLPENFDWPYLARSPSEFWQRWHMSLSGWIRDYVYIPLGGSRRGPLRRAGNALLAMAACGLWHGAQWNFLAWGMYHGAGLAVGHAVGRGLGPLAGEAGGVLGRATPVVAWGATLVFVALGWVLFFYPLPQALRMLRLLLGLG
jgi:alginate O-acetyltransferase complex protein AlgI